MLCFYASLNIQLGKVLSCITLCLRLKNTLANNPDCNNIDNFFRGSEVICTNIQHCSQGRTVFCAWTTWKSKPMDLWTHTREQNLLLSNSLPFSIKTRGKNIHILFFLQWNFLLDSLEGVRVFLNQIFCFFLIFLFSFFHLLLLTLDDL